jgi:hypothetical protein
LYWELDVNHYFCLNKKHLFIMSFSRSLILLITLVPLILFSCNGSGRQQPPPTSQPAQRAEVPQFNEDYAYDFVEKQVSFGPRVPNTRAHELCGDWLEQTLRGYSDTVFVQRTRVRAFDGTLLNIRNIIGSFRPETANRVLLCAHWDSRPFADYDPEPANHYTPIDGANDGASGVGVLLEIARVLNENPPPFGIDIILFDAEDYGSHRNHQVNNDHSWALGSQHWARNPHVTGYDARYGILLDMVGANDATFLHEGFSRMYAPDILRRVWATAQRAGYGHFFLDQQGSYITDDHYYINTIRNIPTINIIHQDQSTDHGFFPQWHTVDDTMENIDRETLKAVGQTVLKVIFTNP